MASRLIQITATGLALSPQIAWGAARTTGTATAGASTTLTDTNNTFKSNTTSIASSTDATPIEITTSAAHGFATGDLVTVASHTTNTNANGTWTITRVSATKFTLDGSTATGGGAGGAAGTVIPYEPLRLVGSWLVLTGGTGAGQARQIGSNTATVLTIAGANWTTNPSTDTTYAIYKRRGPVFVRGVTLTGAGNDTTVILEDTVAGSGTALIDLRETVVTGWTKETVTWTAAGPQGIPFHLGVYATVAGTTPKISIEYDWQ